MTRYAAVRNRRPMAWLLAGILTDLMTYWTATDLSAPAFWILLDLWLTYRIYRGGGAALAWFRFLLALGAFLSGILLVLSHLNGDYETGATAATMTLSFLSLWCLAAPALTWHVERSRSEEPALIVGTT